MRSFGLHCYAAMPLLNREKENMKSVSEPIGEALVRGICVELCSTQRRKSMKTSSEPIGEASVRGICVGLCSTQRRKRI